MDENGTDRKPDLIQITLGSSEYTLVAGGSMDIEVLLANAGPSNFFIVNLLGIPPGWVVAPEPSAVWVATGGQERVTLTVCPPAAAEGIPGSYPARLYVFSQSSPNTGKEIPVLLNIIPPGKVKKTFTFRVETVDLTAAPGAKIKIPLLLSNSSLAAEFLELSVQGVPVNWVSLPSPVISLMGGEDKVVDLYLQIPTMPEIQAGKYPLHVSIASQKDPDVKEEVSIHLTIAAFESKGPVGVMLGTVQFSAAPGGSFTVPLTILNRGLVPATFRLGVEGLPISWVSTSTPVTPLKPGESKEIAMLVRPPLSPASQAGRRKFRIVVMNQEIPEQVVKVECILTLAAFTQFHTGLEPQEAEAGKPVMVMVKNEGNTPQAFHLDCVSQDNKLLFEYLAPEGVIQPDRPAGGGPAATVGDPTVMQIPPGQSAAFKFTARPRQRSWIGTPVSYPYHASVRADQKESAPLPGVIEARGLIPLWVFAVFMILCLWMGFSATFTLFSGRFQASGATQTAVAATAQVVGVTQTVIANQTAAAIAGQQDTDGDGLTNQAEAGFNTDPNNADTDRDGLMDGVEANQTRTNPLAPDSDGDGLLDGDEVQRKTNPLNPDTDADGSRDGDEVRLGTNPLKPDTDSDGLGDGAEPGTCPNALDPDSDRDGVIDGKDLNPCDAYNPAMTATGIAAQPTASDTPLPPAITPTQTAVPVVPPIQPLPNFPGLILFDSNRTGNPEIYALDKSGQIRQMTNNSASDQQGVWAPNMQRIAFTSNREGQNDVYIMNADGTNAVNLTNNPADDQQPTWSSDGGSILFTSNRDGNYEIYAVQVNNLQTINLTNSPGNDTQPGWIQNRSRDLSGDYILFTSDRDGNQEIYRMKSDGTGAINLTMNLASDQMAKGSPDGALVAFTSDRTGNMDVFTMSLDGQSLTNLTNNPSSDFGPAWSSDQVWIAFTSDRSGNRDVHIIKPRLSELYDVTNSPGSQDQVSDWR